MQQLSSPCFKGKHIVGPTSPRPRTQVFLVTAPELRCPYKVPFLLLGVCPFLTSVHSQGWCLWLVTGPWSQKHLGIFVLRGDLCSITKWSERSPKLRQSLRCHMDSKQDSPQFWPEKALVMEGFVFPIQLFLPLPLPFTLISLEHALRNFLHKWPHLLVPFQENLMQENA